MSEAPLAAITGATGLLGRAAVQRLTAEGWRVRQLVRKPSSSRPANIETLTGSFDDEDCLRRLVRGADVVVHTGGVNSAWRAADYYNANVDGNYRLGRAIRAAAPGAHLVVVSTLAARAPWLSAYAASKADGEDAVVDAAGTRAWTVLRLGPVYGPGDRKTLALLQAATWPVMPVPDRPQARISLLHVDDAAAAILGACAARRCGHVWEVGDKARSWTEIARAVIRAVAGTPKIIRLSPRLLAIGVALTHPLGSKKSPLLTPTRMGEFFHDDWAARPERQPPSPVWRVGTPLDDGLFRTAQWFQINGWLAPPAALTATQQRG